MIGARPWSRRRKVWFILALAVASWIAVALIAIGTATVYRAVAEAIHDQSEGEAP